MSLPETDAKFDGNCKKCGAKWKTGDKIYKINQQYWCSNGACPTPVETEQPPINGNYKDVHDEVWAFAIEEARKIYPVVWKGVPGNEAGVPEKRIDINLRERMIVAEVFYKKLMDWHIHHEN